MCKRLTQSSNLVPSNYKVSWWPMSARRITIHADFVGGIACRMPRAIRASPLCATEHTGGFCCVRGNCIHQRRRQAVIRLQL
jgi:hypothetical protein